MVEIHGKPNAIASPVSFTFAKLPAGEERGSSAPHCRNDTSIYTSDLPMISVTSHCIALYQAIKHPHNMLQISPFLFSQNAWEYAVSYAEAMIVYSPITLPTALPKDPLLFATLLFIAVITSWYLLQFLDNRPRNSSRNPSQTLSGPQTINSPSRPLGVWIPVEFQRPAASPYPDWNINTTEPLPYRPFKFGPGHITMGLRAMKWDEWIELDNRYLKWHAIKAKRIKERGDKCCKTAPEAYDAAIELLEEL